MKSMKKQILIILVSLTSIFSCNSTAKTTAMSFNIRYDNSDDGINRWDNRKEMVVDVFREKKVDIAGMQEVLKHQLDYITKKLPEYEFYGIGRDDGKDGGEFCPVMYLKSRYTLLDKNTFWLSETPEKPGNLCWNTVCNRVCSWVKLKDKKSGEVLYFFNTHFSHVSDEARKKSADMLLAEIARIAGKSKVILTGDFNLTRDTEAYQKLVNNPACKIYDTVNLARYKFTDRDHTSNGWKDKRKGALIDYIFVSESVDVKHYEIYYKKVGEIFVSDHYPVICELDF